MPGARQHSSRPGDEDIPPPVQLPASAIAGGGGAKAAGLRSAKAHAAGAAARDAVSSPAAADAIAGGTGSKAQDTPGGRDSSVAAAGVQGPLEDWGGGQAQGQQSWDESAPSGRLLGTCQTLTC